MAFFACFTISGTEKLVQFIGTKNFMKEEIKMYQDGRQQDDSTATGGKAVKSCGCKTHKEGQ